MFTYFLLLSFFLGACSIFKTNANRHSLDVQALTQTAVFQFLTDDRNEIIDVYSIGLIKIDPLLCVRDTNNINGTLHFSEPMYSSVLRYPLTTDSMRLVIPDSLLSKYRYMEKGLDCANDYSTIYQFSQLLETNDPKVFIIQSYDWETTCDDTAFNDDTLCYRTAFRHYLKFRIEDKKVSFLGYEKSSDDSYDWIGIGGVFKSEMRKNSGM